MNFGKREKMITGGVAAAALMAVLHFVLFQPSSSALQEARGRNQQVRGTLGGMKTVENADAVKDFETSVTLFLDRLSSGVTRLGLNQPEPFVLTPVVVPEGTTADLLPPILEAADAANAPKVAQQIPYLLGEVARLQELKTTNSQTRLPFLDATQGGWALPVTLPQNMQGPALWDQVQKLASYRSSLNNMAVDTPQYLNTQAQLYYAMQYLGVNLAQIDQMTYYGEFVPVIDRLALANLIIRRMDQAAEQGNPVIVNGRPLTAEIVIDIVGVDVKTLGQVMRGLEESKLYFLYESVRSLNRLVALAMQTRVEEISQVYIDGYGLLRKQSNIPFYPPGPLDLSRLPNDELAMGQVATAGPADDYFADDAMAFDEALMMEEEMMMNEAGMEEEMGMEGPVVAVVEKAASEPLEDEIGLTIPIKMIYQASNESTWHFIYEVLRQQRLTELQRLQFTTLSQYQPTSTNVMTTATFLVVPQVFQSIEALEQKLQQIQTGVMPAPSAPLEGEMPVDEGAVL